MRLVLSLGQQHIQFGNPTANFEQIHDWTREAKRRNSSLILFPELCMSGYDLEHCEQYATPLDEGVFSQWSKLARENQISLGGSTLERWKGQVYNTFALFGEDGQCRAVYRKTHLFGPMQERQWLTAGQAFEQVEMAWGQTGLSICYDLRFPEMWRHYAVHGAQVVLVVAEWPMRRITHWQTLLRARALENQFYVVGCNSTGPSGEESFGGHSMIVDPWGQTVIEGETEATLMTAEIDLMMVEEVRRIFPVLVDRRIDLYGDIGQPAG